MFGLFEIVQGILSFPYGIIYNNILILISGGFVLSFGCYLFLMTLYVNCISYSFNGPFTRHFETILNLVYNSKYGFAYHVLKTLFFVIVFGLESVNTKNHFAVFSFMFNLVTSSLLCKAGIEHYRNSHTFIPLREIIIESNSLLYIYECEWCQEKTDINECSKCVCCFCYQSMHLTEVIQFERCVHVFHKECYEKYEQEICPICRKN